jgi:hypothetical protein
MEAACGDSGASHGDDDLAAASVAMYQIPDGLGDLAHANDPTPPARPDDEHLLPGLDLAHIPQRLEGGEAGDGHGRRLRNGEVRWFRAK